MGISIDNGQRTARRMEENARRLGNIHLYTLTELEPILGVTHRTLQNYIRNGRLKGVKLGGKWKISEENLQRLISGEDKPIAPEMTDEKKQEMKNASVARIAKDIFG